MYGFASNSKKHKSRAYCKMSSWRTPQHPSLNLIGWNNGFIGFIGTLSAFLLFGHWFYWFYWYPLSVLAVFMYTQAP